MIFHHLLFVCCVWLAVLLSTVAANPAGRQRRQISATAAAVRSWPAQYFRRAYLSSSDNQRNRVRFLIRPDSEWAGGRNWWTRKRFENGQSTDKVNFIFYS